MAVAPCRIAGLVARTGRVAPVRLNTLGKLAAGIAHELNHSTSLFACGPGARRAAEVVGHLCDRTQIDRGSASQRNSVVRRRSPRVAADGQTE